MKAQVHRLRKTRSQAARRRVEAQARAIAADDARRFMEAVGRVRGRPCAAYMQSLISTLNDALGELVDAAQVQSFLGKEANDKGASIDHSKPSARAAAEREFRRVRAA